MEAAESKGKWRANLPVIELFDWVIFVQFDPIRATDGREWIDLNGQVKLLCARTDVTGLVYARADASGLGVKALSWLLRVDHSGNARRGK